MFKEDINKEASAILVIFGATGNLAKKRIFPSLFALFKNNMLPENLKIMAAARSQYSIGDFRDLLYQTLNPQDKKAWRSFSDNISYLSQNFSQNSNLRELANQLNLLEKKLPGCAQRIFYMATAPQIMEQAVESLGQNKLHLTCPIHPGSKMRPKIIVEKPFGHDLASARVTSLKLSAYFSPEQIYRIDHYLGKETVQNILTLRFGNEILEPVWNNNYIDHVQITTAEYIGVENRGEYYDQTGALRDIIQNHMLQLLALTTMEEPAQFGPIALGKKKLESIKSIRVPTATEIIKSTIRGQYRGYLSEKKIAQKSQTETYALVKLFIENKRWRGVPFYLRTGKRLTGKVTSIIIQFKEKGHRVLKNFWQNPLPNHITIQIQPDEGIGIRLIAKKPGLETTLEPVDLEFCYRKSFAQALPDAYERLLLDAISGDQSLFMPQDQIEESWKIIDPIRQVWDENEVKLATYEPGSWGPKKADDLIEEDGRQWLQPLLTICKI